MSHDFPIPRQDGGSRQDGTTDRREPDPEAEPRPEVRAGADTGAGADGDSGATVVSWDGSGSGPGTGRAGLAFGRIGRDGRDGRIVPVVAALGALAVFGSLVEEWTIVQLPSAGDGSGSPGTEPGTVRLTTGISELLTFGTVYVVGISGVLGCLALVLFGSAGVRHNARVLGLVGTGAVLAVLVATTASVEAVATRPWQLYGSLEGIRVEQGRGLVLAYVGTGLFGLALLLARRFVRPPAAAGPPAGPAPGSGPGDPVPAGTSDWPWHRPRSAREPESVDDGDGPGPPIDLTVSPTKPFAR